MSEQNKDTGSEPSEEDTADTSAPVTYEGGFKAIVARMNARRAPLDFAKGEHLPPLDMDFEPLKSALVQDIPAKDLPRAKNTSGHLRKSLELNGQFIGQPELCKLHGLLIAHLRKEAQPEHTMALFTRMWAEEHAFLIAHLDPRWLVSAITTFGDQGKTEVQRRVGQSMTVLFSTMKLYESERLYSGLAPQQAFKLKRLVRRQLPLNMDRFALMDGGLDVNMLGRIWMDAQDDPVIAPLAHHVLDLLNQDDGTVFRRLAVLRGRKQRQLDSTRTAASTASAKAAVSAQPKQHSWSVVSTIKAERDEIALFIAHHLNLGAAHLDIYLDAPLPEADLKDLSNPKTTFTLCDDAYWQSSGTARMEAHQKRQAFNATRSYRTAKTDWLAHIDCDEFIHPSTSVASSLAACADETAAIIMPPAEEIAQSGAQDGTLLFRRTYFDADCAKSVIDTLYPTFGPYLRSGFISHTQGKTIARTGLKDVRFGLHQLKKGGTDISNVERMQDLLVLHRHAQDLSQFERLLDFRLAHGSYRNRDSARLGLGDIIDLLREEHPDDGARLLFEEVCSATPEVLAALDKHNMLVRARLPASPPE